MKVCKDPSKDLKKAIGIHNRKDGLRMKMKRAKIITFSLYSTQRRNRF